MEIKRKRLIDGERFIVLPENEYHAYRVDVERTVGGDVYVSFNDGYYDCVIIQGDEDMTLYQDGRAIYMNRGFVQSLLPLLQAFVQHGTIAPEVE